MDEHFTRQLIGQLSAIEARLGALDTDVRDSLRKIDELEDARHEHSKRFLLPQPADTTTAPSPSPSHPAAVVGGGVAAGGVLGLLIDRLIAFFFGW